MYSTCIYCEGALGTNEAIEAFPVGERLAFDSAKGRLWAVCPHCARWNLTPLDERWEAVEACERLTRNARARATTDTVALFVQPDGTQLIRLGAAKRPEIAAWRYSREYARRLGRAVAVGAAATGAIAATAWAVGAFIEPVGIFALWPFGAGLVANGANVLRFVRRGVGRVPVRGPDGKRYQVSRSEFDQVQLVKGASPDAWGLYVKHTYGHFTLEGDAAARALGRLMTTINAVGALPATVRDAQALVGDGDANALLRVSAEQSERAAGDYARQLSNERAGRDRNGLRPGQPGFEYAQSPYRRHKQSLHNEGALYHLSATRRLAIEMAVHEDTERRAMEHELAPLVAAWREAEEIAGIADALLTPPSVASELARLTRGRGARR